MLEKANLSLRRNSRNMLAENHLILGISGGDYTYVTSSFNNYREQETGRENVVNVLNCKQKKRL